MEFTRKNTTQPTMTAAATSRIDSTLYNPLNRPLRLLGLLCLRCRATAVTSLWSIYVALQQANELAQKAESKDAGLSSTLSRFPAFHIRTQRTEHFL
jgi:hypothetical protein